MQIDRLLEESVRRYPDKTAVVSGDERVTYAELWRRVQSFAAGLVTDCGVTRGDRVVIELDSSIEAVVAIYGVLRAGAVFVVLHPSTRPSKTRYVLEDSGASCLVTDVRHAKTLGEVLGETHGVRAVVLRGDVEKVDDLGHPTFGFADLAGADKTPPPRAHISTDLAALIYTSGSSGAPKGVMSAHANIDAASRSIITYLENTPDDIILNTLPLSFDYGLYQVLMALRFAGTVVLEKSFAYVHTVLTRAVEEKVTGLPLVPTLATMLLQHDLSRYDLSHLRYLTNTAAALPADHIQRLRETFPQAQLYSMYGLTECKRVSYLPPAELDRRPESVGVAMPDTEVMVVDDDGEVVGPGVIGELVVRGPHVMLGYWNNPEATARAYRPGKLPREVVLYTGDLFKTDDEGFLYFVGRTDDIIKSGGEKVAPKEIEKVLYGLPEVTGAAVVGPPDELLGQRIKAFVSLAEGSSLEVRDLAKHCKSQLEDLLVPHAYEIRERLPTNESGKIDKRALLQEELGEGEPQR
jgi:amino acid adenylation domain-containing protein